MFDFAETQGIVPVLFEGFSGTRYKLQSQNIHSDGISNVLHIDALYKRPWYVSPGIMSGDFHIWKCEKNVNGMSVIISPLGWGDTYCKTYIMCFHFLLNSGRLIYNNEIDFLREIDEEVKRKCSGLK